MQHLDYQTVYIHFKLVKIAFWDSSCIHFYCLVCDPVTLTSFFKHNKLFLCLFVLSDDFITPKLFSPPPLLHVSLQLLSIENISKLKDMPNTAIGHKAEALVTRQHQTGAGGVAPFALGFKEPSSPAEINGRQEKGYFCVMLLPSLLSCLI